MSEQNSSANNIKEEEDKLKKEEIKEEEEQKEEEGKNEEKEEKENKNSNKEGKEEGEERGEEKEEDEKNEDKKDVNINEAKEQAKNNENEIIKIGEGTIKITGVKNDKSGSYNYDPSKNFSGEKEIRNNSINNFSDIPNGSKFQLPESQSPFLSFNSEEQNSLRDTMKSKGKLLLYKLINIII